MVGVEDVSSVHVRRRWPMELSTVAIEMPEGINVIVGQAHFVKTVEDVHEVVVGANANIQFGLAFCEASGPCLIRCSGNAADLVELAARNAESIGAGHSFILYLRDGYPVNVLNALKLVPEVCTVFCATANPLEVLIAQTDLGRGILGVVDGMPPAGVETEQDSRDRKDLLRVIGYKL
jgi:adenosine/AMP kinase